VFYPVSLKVPPANLVSDAFRKRLPVGGPWVWWRERYCRDDWLRLGTVMSILEHYVIIDDEGEGEDGDEINGCG